MKVDFALPEGGGIHRICLRCHAGGVERDKRDGLVVYTCPSCGHSEGRSLYWGVNEEWVSEDDELWHGAAAVFVCDLEGRVLLFERTEFPYGQLTVPAGHIDKGESAEKAAHRELYEEAGIRAAKLTHAITLDFPEESCSGGADAHRWHVYVLVVDRAMAVDVSDDEGRNPMWLTPEEAMAQPLLPPVRRLLDILDLSGEHLPIITPLPVALRG